jgi:phosphosulfolactate synthase
VLDDPYLQEKAFPFIPVAPRSSKPRASGLTSIADRGLGESGVKEVLETGGDFIDLAKISAGMFRLQPAALLRRKIEIYHTAGIKVFIAGDVSEAAFLHGLSTRYYQTARELGAEAVEISSAQVAMSLPDKCRLIEMAASAGLLPIAEIGEKAQEAWTANQSYVIAQIKAYQQAGAWKVLFQDEGVSRGVDEMKTDFILNVVSQFDVQDFLFQTKLAKAQAWLIGAFGNCVNLDVDSHQVLEIEAMRRGIRGRGLFGLIGSLGTHASGKAGAPRAEPT